MRLSTLSTLLLPTALACNHAHIARQAESNGTLPFTYIQGDDPPADPATKGYFINHIGLMVSNITQARQWYSDVLGLRHIFTMEMSPEYTIAYMAHSQGGRNGTGFQTGVEMARDKNNMAGLVELQEYSRATNRTYAPDSHTTFSHLGLIVDDIAATQERFESLGVHIISRSGELDLTGETEESRILGAAWGFTDMTSAKVQEDIQKALPAMEAIGFREFLIAADPDGNLFEIQSLNPTTI